MTKYRFTALVEMPVFTLVDAESMEEAERIARARPLNQSPLEGWALAEDVFIDFKRVAN